MFNTFTFATKNKTHENLGSDELYINWFLGLEYFLSLLCWPKK